MQWLDQMPWVVAAVGLVVAPTATYVVKRLEQRDERAGLLADAELYSKLGDSKPKELLGKTLAIRTAGYTDRWILAQTAEPYRSSLARAISRVCYVMGVIAAVLALLAAIHTGDDRVLFSAAWLPDGKTSWFYGVLAVVSVVIGWRFPAYWEAKLMRQYIAHRVRLSLEVLFKPPKASRQRNDSLEIVATMLLETAEREVPDEVPEGERDRIEHDDPLEVVRSCLKILAHGGTTFDAATIKMIRDVIEPLALPEEDLASLNEQLRHLTR
ncbi:hypothetical protein GS483_19525 [Rhodococcus hoagii]|nr:hypothetical protein [Prescottella equi]